MKIPFVRPPGVLAKIAIDKGYYVFKKPDDAIYSGYPNKSEFMCLAIKYIMEDETNPVERWFFKRAVKKELSGDSTLESRIIKKMEYKYFLCAVEEIKKEKMIFWDAFIKKYK